MTLLEKSIKNVLKQYEDLMLNETVIERIIADMVKKLEKLMSGK